MEWLLVKIQSFSECVLTHGRIRMVLNHLKLLIANYFFVLLWYIQFFLSDTHVWILASIFGVTGLWFWCKNSNICIREETLYREFSPYANFISANFITAIFQNFPKIFGLCVFRAIYFINAIFILGKCDLWVIYFITLGCQINVQGRKNTNRVGKKSKNPNRVDSFIWHPRVMQF